MTLIEIFDRTPIENVITTLALRPERTVFVGSDYKKIARAVERFKRIFNGRMMKCDIDVVSVTKNDLEDITEALCGIISSEPMDEQFVIDISGGDDSTLVAVGMMIGMFSDRMIHIFRINPSSRKGILYRYIGAKGGKISVEKTIYDFSASKQIELTCEENIILHGGKLISKGREFEIVDSEADDVEALWNISKRDPSGWNAKIGKLSALSSRYAPESGVRTIAKDSVGRGQNDVDSDLWNELVRRGLIVIDRERSGGGSWYFTYKNKIVEECLCKAGSALEYRTYLAAKRAEKNGSRIFSDVQVSVVIGWDEDIAGIGGTQNEIDCMMMCGACPVFISCKNGDVKTDELYKLGTVSDEFGSEYARAVLLSTVYFDEESRSFVGERAAVTLKDRASEMGIRLISKAHRKAKREFDKDVASLGW